jgi:CRP/FNR family transcriptional regulator, anaerobic regulatory protein
MDSSLLFTCLSALAELTEEEKLQISPLLVPAKFERGAFLSEEGKVCDHIAFINKGYLRIYITDDVEEITVNLAGPGDFISSFASFLSRTPSLEYVRAVTDAEVFLIHYDHLQLLYKHHHFEKLGRRIIENYFIEKDNRVVSLIKDSAETRYKKFMNESPDFLLNMPLQYIASFLGIKPETLSRIRAKSIS